MDQDETWHVGRLRPWPHCVRWGPSSLSPKGHIPQFSAHVCFGHMAGWIKMPLGMELGLGPGDFVLDGDPAPLPQKGGRTSPIFGPCLLWPNGWMDQDGTWHGCEPRSRSHCARWRPSSTPLKGHSPQFSVNVRCGQTPGWTKMPLGMEVGLSPGDFVFDGHPAPPKEKGTVPPPNFWPMSVVVRQLDGLRCLLVQR